MNGYNFQKKKHMNYAYALFGGCKFSYSARSAARFGEQSKAPSAIFWIFLRILSVLNSYNLQCLKLEKVGGGSEGGGGVNPEYVEPSSEDAFLLTLTFLVG